MNELKIKDLEVKYKDNIVLKNFDIVINKNELLVMLGPSGCGKSTLLSSISGLVTPECGEILFDDKILFSSRKKINMPVENRNIGFVFQSYALWPHMNVFDNISYPLKIRKLRKNIIEERVYYLLEAVNLKGKEKCYPWELSGGEKQRVSIARAIAVNPVLLLLDEPLANIDEALKIQLLNLISKLKKELNIPMLYVTHDQREAFEIADRIVIMKDGEIIQDGCPKHVYRHPKDLFVANFMGCNNVLKSCQIKNKFCANSLLAIRPEDITISKNGKYKGIIKKIKFKGYSSELFVKFGDNNIIINVNNDNYNVGDYIQFDIKRVHILDEQTNNYQTI